MLQSRAAPCIKQILKSGFFFGERIANLNQSQTIASLCEALVKAQADFTPARENKINPHFRSRYADLEAIIAVARPSMAKYGLGFMQLVKVVEGRVCVETMVFHKSGEFISETLCFRPDKETPQAYSSAATYAKRVGLASALGIATTESDDDGNAASGCSGMQAPSGYTDDPPLPPPPPQVKSDGFDPENPKHISFVMKELERLNVILEDEKTFVEKMRGRPSSDVRAVLVEMGLLR